MLTLILVVIVFSVLVMIHELGHFLTARKFGIDVEIFSLGMGKRVWGIKKGGTDYRISLIPFGGYVKMSGDDPLEAKGAPGEFLSKPVGHRFWVIIAGSLTNYIFAFLLFWVIFMMGVPTLSNEVGEVLKEYPAYTSGIEPGDKILSINGNKTEYWEDIVEEIKAGSDRGRALVLDIDRNGEMVRIDVSPQISEVKNIFGQTISRPMLGIAPQSKILSVRYGPLKALYHGGKKLIAITLMTYKMIWLLISGGMPLKGTVSGPIGIARIIGQSAGVGIIPLLITMAHISMALAIFNLLPIPVLDGGHALFLGIEKIKGSPVSLRLQENLTTFFLFLLIALIVFVSWQDILKTPLGDKITKVVQRK